MTRTVVVLERRQDWLPRWLPARQRFEDRRELIIRRLGERFRFMPDTADRLDERYVEIPFPPRKPIAEAREEVRHILNRIDPDWRQYLGIINEPY
jgi:hypothetical protein